MNYFSLILGWLLGILSTVLGKLLIDWINRCQKKEEIKRSLFAELKEVRHRLVGTSYRIHSTLGTLNRELINWSFNILSEGNGIETTTETLRAMEDLRKLDDKQIGAAAKAVADGEGGNALSLKKFFLPFLDANISNLSLCNISFQSLILEIRAKLNLLNEEIDLGRFFYEKTFDSSMSKENHQIITGNLNKLYQKVAEAAHQTADKITELIKNY